MMTMEVKFSAGPWSVPHFARPDVNCSCEYVLSDAGMGAICCVYASGEGNDWEKHGDNPKFEQAVANAHLIAAAPDLYEALKKAEEQLIYLDRQCFKGSTGPVVNEIRAALNKANPSPA